MEIVGYTDPLSVELGSPLRLYVHTSGPEYRVEVHRLIHGLRHRRGPGLRSERVESSAAGSYPGVSQPIYGGSFVRLENDVDLLGGHATFSVIAWVFPTSAGGRVQSICGQWAVQEAAGWSLGIAESGALSFRVGDGDGSETAVEADVPLMPREWTWVAASYDSTAGRATVYQAPLRRWSEDPSSIGLCSDGAPVSAAFDGIPFVIGASAARREVVMPLRPCDAVEHFNGKVGGLRLLGRALAADELGKPVAPTDADVVAAWDFSADVQSAVVRDRSRAGAHGVCVNLPTRGVTGAEWDGGELSFRHAPAMYDAIHFHDDDLEDAGWENPVVIETGELPRSGVYSAEVENRVGKDSVTFFVTATPATASSSVAVLMPTIAYLAYGNDLGHFVNDAPEFARATPYERAIFDYVADNRLLSLYDRHTDGSGVCYASTRRPILSIRPMTNHPSWRFETPAHNLNVDLCLIDWLETKGWDYDVITDHAVHEYGTELLDKYAVVLTGGHPEYTTEPMLDAFEAYLTGGGRFMYLGGNGFYWVTAVDPERPYVIEIRRGRVGHRPWSAAPGEGFLSSTGEPGGLWRDRGRAPQRLFGVGYSAVGPSTGSHWPFYAAPYLRTPDSLDASMADLFAGVDEHELIGDFGLVLGGAAGLEIDRVDLNLGTPPHTKVLASSVGHAAAYFSVDDPVLFASQDDTSDLIRSDIVYVEYPNGGAVFSVGSMSWLGCLSTDAYNNNVSTVTENVLKRFTAAQTQR